ncbi:fumarylacetoacetate hydrolase family protein [Nocardia violaceofusca]|uniref:fumarylacetoacetate hydrolase family protein n=1 Tax=Nocardia violaceofusca TaxID=941182 RepID=UPI0007A50FCC|nr:fumarylacetoacetate hydrolase family protein [Nocardia violaceofusca]
MKIGNLGDRLVIVTAAGTVDVQRASGGRFAAEPQAVYERWTAFREWADSADLSAAEPLDPTLLRPPVPRPPQIFAIGLNYRQHATESGLDLPSDPLVFTKFASCLTGAHRSIPVPTNGTADWEIELAVVIGVGARNVSSDRAWEHVAGVAVAQDISERAIQFRGSAPQFSLGKSLPGYGPIGPWLVTPDELPDPDDLHMTCTLNGEEVQKTSTKDMIFPVPQLISRLSALLPLLPGDLLFTGTPAGIGSAMNPPRFLKPGQTLISRIDGVGELRNPIVAADPA